MNKSAKSQMRNSMAAKQLSTCLRLAAADFQKLVRLRAADKNGFCQCATCDKKVHWKSCDGGHFISRRFQPTLFDERNVHVQCVACNRYPDQQSYLDFMIVTYGPEVVAALQAKKNNGKVWTRDELCDMRIAWRDEIRTLS